MGWRERLRSKQERGSYNSEFADLPVTKLHGENGNPLIRHSVTQHGLAGAVERTVNLPKATGEKLSNLISEVASPSKRLVAATEDKDRGTITLKHKQGLKVSTVVISSDSVGAVLLKQGMGYEDIPSDLFSLSLTSIEGLETSLPKIIEASRR